MSRPEQAPCQAPTLNPKNLGSILLTGPPTWHAIVLDGGGPPNKLWVRNTKVSCLSLGEV